MKNLDVKNYCKNSYKAKDINNEKWVYGQLIYENWIIPHTLGAAYETTPKFDKVTVCATPINPETICFASSRIDKKGNTIFSNDILLCKTPITGEFTRGIVVYDGTKFYVKFGEVNISLSDLELNNIERIGSYIDDPLLLESIRKVYTVCIEAKNTGVDIATFDSKLRNDALSTAKITFFQTLSELEKYKRPCKIKLIEKTYKDKGLASEKIIQEYTESEEAT